MMEIIVPSRYTSELINTLDTVCYVLYYPWVTCFSFIISCYVSTIREKQEPQKKLVDYFLFGPICVGLLILLLPLGLLGIFLWLILCSTCIQEKYTYVAKKTSSKLSRRKQCSEEDNLFTFCTANILLGPECLNRLNNNTSAYIRAPKIAQRILRHSGKPLINFEALRTQFSGNATRAINLRDSVITSLPSIDFLCLQEVWERFHAKVLIKYLEKEYPYILYDVGEYKWNINFCLFGKFSFEEKVYSFDSNQLQQIININFSMYLYYGL